MDRIKWILLYPLQKLLVWKLRRRSRLTNLKQSLEEALSQNGIAPEKAEEINDAILTQKGELGYAEFAVWLEDEFQVDLSIVQVRNILSAAANNPMVRQALIEKMKPEFTKKLLRN
ncbi:MAG: hypothetical protein LBM27_00480 [Lactobacillaceae bacterium]|nr:hypothetical protein [Lactobacillaceae bacterium]